MQAIHSTRRRGLLALLSLAGLLTGGASLPAHAAWPDKPVKIVVPWSEK